MARESEHRLTLNSFGDWLNVHWFAVFVVVYGLWVWTPWLAPIFMQLGWTSGGKTIYFAYSLFCHQLPERSYFLFGPKAMYSLSEIQAAWQDTINPMVLRKFIGTAEMGWKLAWSDRMVWFYTSVWVFALAWRPLKGRIKPLRWWCSGLLILPIAIDGVTHAVSDVAGLGLGFRDSNAWLAGMTQYNLQQSFYRGDAIGSFNSLMRLITGVLAGLGITWAAFPFIENAQTLNRELDERSYERVLEEIRLQDSRSPCG